MTWGGNRLKQELNLLGPAIFEVNTPPVPCSEKVSRTGDLFIFSLPYMEVSFIFPVYLPCVGC
jgi:hypothetical protein